MAMIEHAHKRVKTFRFNVHSNIIYPFSDILVMRDVLKEKPSVRDLIFYLLNVLSVRLAILSSPPVLLGSLYDVLTSLLRKKEETFRVSHCWNCKISNLVSNKEIKSSKGIPVINYRPILSVNVYKEWYVR